MIQFKLGNTIEGLLPLFWGPALHNPFKKEGVIFFKPFKMNGKKKINRFLMILCEMLIAKYEQTYLVVLDIIIGTNMLRCYYRFNILKHQCFINEIVLSFHHVCSLVLLIL